MGPIRAVATLTVMLLVGGCTGRFSAISGVSSAPDTASPAPTTAAPNAYPALPPCAPPRIAPMPAGKQLTLDWAQPPRRSPHTAQARMTVGSTLVIAMGGGCDTAVDFKIDGPARVTAIQKAPLPDSGANAAQLTADSVGVATIQIVGVRTCSKQGVTSGTCYGEPGLLGTVTVVITEA